MEHYILSLLITYKYIALIPAGFIEGQLISLTAGYLTSQGYLNPFLAGLCISTGNLIGDIGLYTLGRYRGRGITTTLGRFLGITPARISTGTKIFTHHSNAVLFISKITNGLGLSFAVLFTAGILRIPFKQFICWNILGEVFWTGGLITVGYLLGTMYHTADTVLYRIGLTSIVSIIILMTFLLLRRFISKKLQSSEQF